MTEFFFKKPAARMSILPKPRKSTETPNKPRQDVSGCFGGALAT
jgi:hypothetical protein